MRQIYKLILMLGIIIIPLQLFAQDKEVVGCYQSWKWQQDQETLDPRNIPYDKLTIINYSFFYPLESGEIVGMDPVADRFLLQGESDSLSLGKNSNTSMIELAKAHGTKVVLSIGGWETSNNFPQVAADFNKRAIFAHWCVNHIKNYGFDGIDIDWEFMGYKSHNGTEQDKINFTKLLQTVQDSLKELEIKNDRKYILTASLPAAAVHLLDIEVEKISSIVDFINIMTYDLHGSWGKISNHNSALYAPAQGDPGRSLDGAFKLYNETHNVPSHKITLCTAFYGYSYTNCKDMYSPHNGPDTNLFQPGEDILYSDILEKMNLFESHWDSIAHAPYIISKKESTLISYDDEKAVSLKAQYLIDNKAAGIIIWPLMGDYLKNNTTPLVDVIYEKFSK